MKKVTIEIPEGKTLKFKDNAYVLVDDNVMERFEYVTTNVALESQVQIL